MDGSNEEIDVAFEDGPGEEGDCMEVPVEHFQNGGQATQETAFDEILSDLMKVRKNWSKSSKKKTSALMAFVAIVALEKKVRTLSKQSSPRRCWVSKDLLRRYDEFPPVALHNDMRLSDEVSYEDFFGLTKDMFAYLVKKTSPLIGKQDTVMRKCISVPEKLMATLRFLTTGVTYRHLQYSTSISKAALSLFIPFVCEAIHTVLKEQFLKAPVETEEWLKISKDFEDAFQIPHCVGILGGRHVTLKFPVLSEEFKINNKNTIEVIAIIDSKKRILALDIIVDGSVPVETIYPQSVIDQALKYNVWNFPEKTSLEGRELPIPYFVISNENFPLSENVMKTFDSGEKSEETASYDAKILEINTIFEDFFSYFAKRFRIFQMPMSLHPDKVKNILLASCALHNFCKISEVADLPVGDEPNEEGSGKCFSPISPQRGYRPVNLAVKIRTELCHVMKEKS